MVQRPRSKWWDWVTDDAGAFRDLQRAVARRTLEELLDDADVGVGALERIVEDIYPLDGSASTFLSGLWTPRVAQRRRKRRGIDRGNELWRSSETGAMPPAPVGNGRSWTPWRPPQRALPPPRPRHPIEGLAATAPSLGFMLHISKPVAQHIAGYWAGRPSREWSGLAVVDMTAYQYRGEPSFKWRLRELFRYDDADPNYSERDTTGGTTIPHTWHAKLVDDLLLGDREADLAKLSCHVHSHGSMGAFWSSTDEAMIGGLLSEQTALQSRLHGWVLSVVVGAGLTLKARLDVWEREANAVVYTSYRDLPVYARWPPHVLLADLVSVRAERPLSPQPSLGAHSLAGRAEVWDPWGEYPRQGAWHD